MFMFTLHIAKILAESGFLCITRYIISISPTDLIDDEGVNPLDLVLIFHSVMGFRRPVALMYFVITKMEKSSTTSEMLR